MIYVFIFSTLNNNIRFQYIIQDSIAYNRICYHICMCVYIYIYIYIYIYTYTYNPVGAAVHPGRRHPEPGHGRGREAGAVI